MEKEEEKCKLPDTYFEDFQDRLYSQIALEEMQGRDKTAGYKVPEDYFEGLSQKLLSIPQTQKATTRVIPLKAKGSYWPSISIAAAMLLFLTLYYSKSEADTISLDADDIATYLYSESVDLYTQDITALLTEEELNLIIQGDSNTKEDELINYLETYTNPYDLLIE